ncbi:YlxR family protein [Prauserella alba]|uniref:YlxR family protein n=1 Tax=Prauserella alba TaxID=176898 RepID=UPI0020A26B25|nr:YlxR family protein [Prauserella alba]
MTGEGLVADERRRLPGRGAWVHRDPACLVKAERKRAFPRALRVSGPLDTSAVRGVVERLATGV